MGTAPKTATSDVIKPSEPLSSSISAMISGSLPVFITPEYIDSTISLSSNYIESTTNLLIISNAQTLATLALPESSIIKLTSGLASTENSTSDSFSKQMEVKSSETLHSLTSQANSVPSLSSTPLHTQKVSSNVDIITLSSSREEPSVLNTPVLHSSSFSLNENVEFMSSKTSLDVTLSINERTVFSTPDIQSSVPTNSISTIWMEKELPLYSSTDLSQDLLPTASYWAESIQTTLDKNSFVTEIQDAETHNIGDSHSSVNTRSDTRTTADGIGTPIITTSASFKMATDALSPSSIFVSSSNIVTNSSAESSSYETRDALKTSGDELSTSFSFEDDSFVMKESTRQTHPLISSTLAQIPFSSGSVKTSSLSSVASTVGASSRELQMSTALNQHSTEQIVIATSSIFPSSTELPDTEKVEQSMLFRNETSFQVSPSTYEYNSSISDLRAAESTSSHFDSSTDFFESRREETIFNSLVTRHSITIPTMITQSLVSSDPSTTIRASSAHFELPASVSLSSQAQATLPRLSSTFVDVMDSSRSHDIASPFVTSTDSIFSKHISPTSATTTDFKVTSPPLNSNGHLTFSLQDSMFISTSLSNVLSSLTTSSIFLPTVNASSDLPFFNSVVTEQNSSIVISDDVRMLMTISLPFRSSSSSTSEEFEQKTKTTGFLSNFDQSMIQPSLSAEFSERQSESAFSSSHLFIPTPIFSSSIQHAMSISSSAWELDDSSTPGSPTTSSPLPTETSLDVLEGSKLTVPSLLISNSSSLDPTLPSKSRLESFSLSSSVIFHTMTTLSSMFSDSKINETATFYLKETTSIVTTSSIGQSALSTSLLQSSLLSALPTNPSTQMISQTSDENYSRRTSVSSSYMMNRSTSGYAVPTTDVITSSFSSNSEPTADVGASSSAYSVPVVESSTSQPHSIATSVLNSDLSSSSLSSKMLETDLMTTSKLFSLTSSGITSKFTGVFEFLHFSAQMLNSFQRKFNVSPILIYL